MVLKRNSRLAGVALFAALGGCASQQLGLDPYRAAEYAGAEHKLYRTDGLANLSRSAQTDPETGEIIEATLYRGVEGARKAHTLYSVQVAEQLDGDCEPFVRTAQNETLLDIADYCDVPMATLVGYNPDIENPYNMEAGWLVGVPTNAVGGEGIAGPAAARAELVGLYTLRPGETLNDVAVRFNISTSQLVGMNPQVTWGELQAGERLRLPNVGINERGAAPAEPAPQRIAQQSTAPRYGARAYAVQEERRATPGGWTGYDGYDGVVEDPGYTDEEVASLMPYRLGPIDARDPARAAREAAVVSVDKAAVRAGGSVAVSLVGVPAGTSVTFYRGKSPTTMTVARTVTADADNVARYVYRVPTATSDFGGYLFSAVRADNGATYYSRRVAVMKISRPDTLADARRDPTAAYWSLDDIADAMDVHGVQSVDELRARGVHFATPLSDADIEALEAEAYSR